MAASLYPQSLLDYEQIIQHVYDEPTQSLRTNATVSFAGSVMVEIDAEDGDNIAIQGHPNKYEHLATASFLPAGLDTHAYTSIFSVSSSANNRIKAIKIKADTFGIFRLKKNSVIQDYFQTSVMERNCIFYYVEDLLFQSGDSISIEFVPDRIQGVATYSFFMRIEGYVI